LPWDQRLYLKFTIKNFKKTPSPNGDPPLSPSKT
jgi:hypothetical protein